MLQIVVDPAEEEQCELKTAALSAAPSESSMSPCHFL